MICKVAGAAVLDGCVVSVATGVDAGEDGLAGIWVALGTRVGACVGCTTEVVDVGMMMVLVGLGLPRLQAKAGNRKHKNTAMKKSLVLFTASLLDYSVSGLGWIGGSTWTICNYII